MSFNLDSDPDVKAKCSCEKERYSDILKSNGIHNKIQSVDIVHPDLTGDHLASTCYCVTIHFEEEENEQKKKKPPLELFVKKAVQDAEYAARLRDIMMFEKEATFFNHIIQELQEFCIKKLGSTDFIDDVVPKCYYADPDFIVMENLVNKGYTMTDKKETHSFLQASKVMEQLAKFHSVSYCLVKEVTIDQVLEKYPYLDKNHVWTPEGEVILGPWIYNMIDPALTILNGYPTPGSEKVVEYLNEKKKPPGPFLQLGPLFELKNKSCANVLCHGDLWSANMLFKNNEESGEVEKNILIDLQTIHLGSPVLDLQNYIYLAVFHPLRAQCWKKLIRIYYDHFKANVQLFGHEVDFSFETLVNEYREKCEGGFIFSFYSILFLDSLDLVGDLDKIEGNVIDHMATVFKEHGIKFADESGLEASKKIVQEFEAYQKVVNERD